MNNGDHWASEKPSKKMLKMHENAVNGATLFRIFTTHIHSTFRTSKTIHYHHL